MADASWAQRVLVAYVDGLGAAVSVEEGFGPVTVDVPVHRWVDAVAVARDVLGCAFFDWLSAVDELDDGFRLVCHVARRRPGSVEHLIVSTAVARESPAVGSVGGIFAGARWHERETHEMFGIGFTEGGAVLALPGLLLPQGFEGHPLRKDFVLASRVAKPWPGAKEPGESDAAPRPARSRRRARPPGVPDPTQWGPR
jgi:NADH-quinone oxidoreductase subunit C